MARLPRYTIPGQPQHVILRGNNRSDTFRAETEGGEMSPVMSTLDSDFRFLRRFLRECVASI